MTFVLKYVLPALGLLLELGFTLFMMIWGFAFLGFADEGHRSERANLFGKAIATICILLSISPVASTLWVIWRRFFSHQPWDGVKYGYFQPLAVFLAALIVYLVLLFIFNIFGYSVRAGE